MGEQRENIASIPPTAGLPAPIVGTGGRRPARRVAMVLGCLVVAGLTAAAAVYFLFNRFSPIRVYYIPSEAMEPTLMGHEAGFNRSTGESRPTAVHDRILVDTLAYGSDGPQPGDIVVFRAPKEADFETNHTSENVLVKRVIGVPGDTIEVKDGAVWRNAARLDEPVCNDEASNEPCIKERMQPYQSGDAQFAVAKPLTLEKDQYFVMGDNRNHSNDSRFWGPLKRDHVIGRVDSIISPSERARSFH